MKRIDLFHPRIFHDQVWAEGYYKRNRKSIEKVGKRLVELLKSMGFTGGAVLDVWQIRIWSILVGLHCS